MISMSAWLWERIPDKTRERDYAKALPGADLDEWGEPKGPLRQFLDVLSVGFSAVRGDADSIDTLLDIDTCPDEFLPHLAALFGFDFPYDLSVDQQRNYLHTIISMYRTKGTAWTLRLAALRIIGRGFDLTVKNEDYLAKTFEVEFSADEDVSTPQLDQKLRYMVKEYKPAGMIPTITIVYYLTESTDIRERISDEHTSTQETPWRMNFVGHYINDNIRTNERGTIELSI